MKFSCDDILAVVLEYHRPTATLLCIESLAAAGLRNIMLWDNSTDDGATRSVLNDAIAKNANLQSVTTVFGKNHNLGFSAGVNAAIEHASRTRKFPYVLLMNNDAIINAAGLVALMEAMKKNPGNVLAAPKYLNPRKQSSARLYYHRYWATLSREKQDGNFAFLSGCCLLIDLDKAGLPLLDDAFFMYGEDVALSSRLQQQGYTLAVTEKAIVEHAGAASSIVGSAFYEYHVVRGHLLLTSRIATSQLDASILWPTRFIYLAARSVVRSIRHRRLIPLTAFIHALLGKGVH